MVNKRGQIYERNVRHAYLFLRRHFGSRSTVIPSPRGQDLSFSRWRRCYKSRGSFPVYLAAVVQKRSNAPVLGQKLATKVSKSRAIPPYVPGVTPPGWPLISALLQGIFYISRPCTENVIQISHTKSSNEQCNGSACALYNLKQFFSHFQQSTQHILNKFHNL